MLWESKEKVQRVIVADIDPKHKGEEIISVDANGEVVYSYLSSGQWANDILWVDTESLTGAAAGELDAGHPGREIIVGGSRGVVLSRNYKDFVFVLAANPPQFSQLPPINILK